MSRLAFISALLLSCLASVDVFSADFRIDTKVFVDDAQTPEYETVTLFQRRVVYDFLSGAGGEITIYDPHAGRFILLDEKREVKTEISEKVLLEFVAAMKLRAMKGAWTAREAANPQFRIAYDEGAQTLSLTGKRLEYVVQASHVGFPSADAMQGYYDFIDMYTRLNATRKHALPPQARLEVNRAMAEHDMLPASVQRTMKSSNPLLGKSIVARSEHVIAWRLVREDQDMIDRAAKCRAQFREVDFGEYRQLDVSPQ